LTIIEATAHSIFAENAHTWNQENDYYQIGEKVLINSSDPEYTVIDVNGRTLNFDVCTWKSSGTKCGDTDKFTLTK